MANYEHYDQDQTHLIILNKEENFPKGTYVRFLNDIIENTIELEPFEKKRKNDRHGKPAKHAKMILKILYYSFSEGIYSYRKIADKTYGGDINSNKLSIAFIISSLYEIQAQ